MLAALLGLGLWIGGAFWFALRGVTPEDKFVPHIAARCGVAVAGGLLIWMLGLYNA